MVDQSKLKSARLPAQSDPLGATGEDSYSASTHKPQPRFINVTYCPDGRRTELDAPSAIIPWSNDHNATLAAAMQGLRRHISPRSEDQDCWLAVSMGDEPMGLAEISPSVFADVIQDPRARLFLCGGAPLRPASNLSDILLLPANSQTDTENFYTFQLMAIGDSSTGKSAFLEYFATGKADPELEATVGYNDFHLVQRFRIPSTGKAVKTLIWDTAGTEKYRSIPTQMLRRVSGLFLMYDITNQETFDNCVNWLNEVRQRAQEGARIILVGNKSDQKAHRQVRALNAEAFASRNGLLFIETSGLEGTNVDLAVHTLVHDVFTKFSRDGSLNKYLKTPGGAQTVDPADEAPKRSWRCGC